MSGSPSFEAGRRLSSFAPAFFVAGLILFAIAPGARADCSIPATATVIDARLEAGGACDEVDAFSIDTPAGTRQVRILRDSRLPPRWREPAALTRRGVEQAAAALNRIGSGRVTDLVILMTGLMADEATETRRDHYQGLALQDTPADECLMVVYPAAAGEEVFAFMVAHEFFHCVQYATAPDQMDGFRAGVPARWWVEGTAEWFANLAFPNSDLSATFLARFDEHSSGRPLIEMGYEATAFFFWYAEERGHRSIIDLMSRMPTFGGADWQARAAGDLLPPADWLSFAQAHLDGGIRYPDGRAIPAAPSDGEMIVWIDSARHSLRADQLVLHRATLVLTCGEWTIAPAGESGTWAVRDEAGSWSSLPASLTIEPGDEKRYLLAAMVRSDEGFRLAIDARQDGAEGCACRLDAAARRGERDMCLVGRWRFVSGGLHETLDQKVAEVERASGIWDSYESDTSSGKAGRELTISEDGRYGYSGHTATWTREAMHGDERFASRVEGESSGAGSWSTSGTRLDLCQISRAAHATVVMELPNETVRMDMSDHFPDHPLGGTYEYDCSPTQLRLSHPTSPLPDLDWVYRRVD